MRHLVLCLVLICTACANGVVNHSITTAQVIKKDANLYRVDDKLYRSEQLMPQDVAIIEQLGIRSIINLRYFNRGANKKLFSHTPIELINQPLLAWNIRPEDIARVLWQIKQQQQHGAVLVHCYHGADRTGIVVAMYRIIYHGWQIEQAKAEMQQGDFGYHGVWKNLDKLFTAENVALVKAHLDQIQALQK